MGEQPLTPDELAQLSQRPPVVAPVDEGPAAPMPGDSLIDRENASPPPAGASTGALPPDAGAWPPPVPEEAPGAVSVAPPLPGGPVAMPPAAGPPMAPGDRMARADADVRTAATDAAKARDASDKAAMDVAESGAPLARQNADLAGQQTVDHQIAALDQQEAQKRYDDADKVAQAKVDEAANARKNFQFRDYWANKSSGQKIASALAVALGAFGAGLTKGPNYALQILDKDMDDDHRQQVEESQRLTDAEVMARTGLKDVAEARRQDLVNRQMNSAIGDQLIATQMREAAARSTDANFQKTVGAYAAKLSADSSEKLLETRAAIRTGLIKEQDDQAKRAEEAARTRLYNAQADAGGYARLAHGRGGAGGGSGHVAQVGANAEELAKRIREGNNGKPLSDDEIIHAATELHIPLAGKAGVTTLQTVRNVAKFDADAQSKAAKTGMQGQKLDEARFKDFEKEHGLPKLEYTHNKLSEVLKKLDSGNSVGAMSSLMEFDAAAKGGNATESSMHAIEGRLGGTWTKIKGAIAKGETGNFAPAEIDTLKGAVKDALGANNDTISGVHDAFGKQFDYSNPAVKQRAAGMFGALGYRSAGGGSPAPASGETVTLRNPKTGETKTVTRAEARALGAIK